MIYLSKFSTLEQYETPLCELVSDVEISVLCESTTEPIEDGGPWDGRDNWI